MLNCLRHAAVVRVTGVVKQHCLCGLCLAGWLPITILPTPPPAAAGLLQGTERCAADEGGWLGIHRHLGRRHGPAASGKMHGWWMQQR